MHWPSVPTANWILVCSTLATREAKLFHSAQTACNYSACATTSQGFPCQRRTERLQKAASCRAFSLGSLGAFPDLRAAGSGPGQIAGHAGNSALTQSFPARNLCSNLQAGRNAIRSGFYYYVFFFVFLFFFVTRGCCLASLNVVLNLDCR